MQKWQTHQKLLELLFLLMALVKQNNSKGKKKKTLIW